MKTINKYLTVKEKEKELFGEVFTPINLICEMLDTLPKSIWADPKLKWLDPSSGVGNFMIIVYYKLMVGLKKRFPSKNNRSKHIINNMLYMVELNSKNVRISKNIFKRINKTATPNILKQDF